MSDKEKKEDLEDLRDEEGQDKNPDKTPRDDEKPPLPSPMPERGDEWPNLWDAPPSG